MTSYVFFSSIRAYPHRDDVLAFVFDSSFRHRPFCGFGHRFEAGRLRRANYHWAKWQDNPNVPMYAHTTNLWVIFSPFNTRFISISSRALELSKSLHFKHVALIKLDRRLPAAVDVRCFHRLVYFITKSTRGLAFRSELASPVRSHEYYTAYRKHIARPFHIRLTQSDLTRLPK